MHVAHGDQMNREIQITQWEYVKGLFILCENSKNVRLSNMADTFLDKLMRCAKVWGLFFSWLCFLDADWLGRRTPITWKALEEYQSLSWPLYEMFGFELQYSNTSQVLPIQMKAVQLASVSELAVLQLALYQADMVLYRWASTPLNANLRGIRINY